MNKALVFIFFVASYLYAGDAVRGELDMVFKKYDQQLVEYPNEIQKQIKAIQDQSENAPQNVKESIEQSAKTLNLFVQNQLPALIAKARKQLSDSIAPFKIRLTIVQQRIKDQATQEFKQAVQAILADADKALNTVVQRAFIGTEQQLKSLEEQLAPWQREEEVKKQQEEAQKKREEREKMRTLFQNLQKSMASVPHIEQLERTVFSQFIKTGVMNSVQLENVVSQYTATLDGLSASYADFHVDIDFKNAANFCTVIMKKLITFFLDDCAVSISRAQKLFKDSVRNHAPKTDYYQILFALAQRLNGRGKQAQTALEQRGYTATITNLAKTYFGEQLHLVVDYFLFKKMTMALDVFGNALLNYSLEKENPTYQDIVVAYELYRELLTNAPVMSDEAHKQMVQRVNTYMAIMYVNKAQKAVENFTTEQNTLKQLPTVIADYQQAADYYRRAGDEANNAQYQTCATYLQTGLDQLLSAQKIEKTEQAAAIDLYAKAYENFTRGGDSVDAQRAYQGKNNVLATSALAQATTTIDFFLKEYATQYQAYIRFVSTIDPETISTNIDQYTPLLNALAKTCQNALAQHADVINALNALAKDVSQETQTSLILKGIQNFAEAMPKITDFIRLGTQNSLNEARALLATLIGLMRQADDVVARQPEQPLTIYPSRLIDDALRKTVEGNQPFSLELLAHRAFAKVCIQKFVTLEDQPLEAMQYLLQAQQQGRFLSVELNAYIAQQLRLIAQEADRVDQLFVDGQTTEKQARALVASAWQAATEAFPYVSQANTMWHAAQISYWNAYQLGKKEALPAYIACVEAYAQAYRTNVAQVFYPNAGSAMIMYQIYAYYQSIKEQKLAQQYNSIIQTSMQQFGDAVRGYLKMLEQADSKQALAAMELIERWRACFEQLLSLQQQTLQQFGNSTLEALLVKEQTSPLGIYTFSARLAGQLLFSIEIPNVDRLYASLYEAQAERASTQQDYAQAYQAYQKALDYYQRVQDAVKTQDIKDKYELAYARALVDSYMHLVIPNEKDNHGIQTMPLFGMNVPVRYELYNYVQQIPSFMPMPINLQNLAQNPTPQAQEQALSELQLFAYLLFINSMLGEKGIQFFDVFSQNFTLRSPPAVAVSLLDVVKDVVARGNTYAALLKQRIVQNQSSLRLQARQAAQTTLYLLSVMYQPTYAVPPLPQTAMSQVPYTGFPLAFTYYFWVQKLTDPSQKTVQYGQKTVRTAEQPDIFKKIIQLMMQTYASAVNQLQEKVTFMFKGAGSLLVIDPLMSEQETTRLTEGAKNVSVLKKINKNDMNVSLAEYVSTFKVVQSYLEAGVATYVDAIAQYGKENQALLAACTAFLSDMYQQLGEYAELFLVGNPQAVEYFAGDRGSWSGVLADMMRYYQLSFGLEPKRMDTLQKRIADAFINAGNLIVARDNFFGALRYYKIAVASLSQLKAVDMQRLHQAKTLFLQTSFNGSTQQMLVLRKALAAPLRITLSNGSQKEISLQDLTDTIVVCPQPSVDRALCATYEELRTSLLDALIYYQNTYIWANIFASDQQTHTSQQEATPQTDENVQKYLDAHGIKLETVEDVVAFIQRDDFETVMSTSFEALVPSSKASSIQESVVMYQALGQWANTIFLAFSKVYLAYFLDNVASQEKFAELIKAIAGERESINAPAEEWIGL